MEGKRGQAQALVLATIKDLNDHLQLIAESPAKDQLIAKAQDLKSFLPHQVIMSSVKTSDEHKEKLGKVFQVKQIANSQPSSRLSLGSI